MPPAGAYPRPGQGSNQMTDGMPGEFILGRYRSVMINAVSRLEWPPVAPIETNCPWGVTSGDAESIDDSAS